MTFESGSVAASVSILLVNNDVPECDETFEAHIVIENGGNLLTGPGLRLGRQPSTTITVMDEGIVIYIIVKRCSHFHYLYILIELLVKVFAYCQLCTS